MAADSMLYKPPMLFLSEPPNRCLIKGLATKIKAAGRFKVEMHTVNRPLSAQTPRTKEENKKGKPAFNDFNGTREWHEREHPDSISNETAMVALTGEIGLLARHWFCMETITTLGFRKQSHIGIPLALYTNDGRCALFTPVEDVQCIGYWGHVAYIQVLFQILTPIPFYCPFLLFFVLAFS